MLKFDIKMAALRCFSAIKINLVQCILCGQNILVDRVLRNSGYLVEREVLSTFRCQFPSKRSFEKFLLKFDFKMAVLRCFFVIKINLVECILCGQYVLADRFLGNSCYLVECEVLSTFGCQFPSKRSFEKSKNTEVCLNLISNGSVEMLLCHKNQPSGMHPMWSIYIG